MKSRSVNPEHVSDTAVSVLAIGDVSYALAACETINSLLDHTTFDIFVSCDASTFRLIEPNPRIHLNLVPAKTTTNRADPFLQKMDALEWCWQSTDHTFVMHIDADAVLVHQVTDRMIEDGLGSNEIGMVEQTGIIETGMNRAQLYEHYRAVSLAFLAPSQSAPPLEKFRYFNSGVILFRRHGLRHFLDWAGKTRSELPPSHAVGQNMIADQDYLQVWANQHRIETCTDLGWQWNHCPLWDGDFPRTEALIAHLSNFCNGPAPQTIERLRQLRTGRSPNEMRQHQSPDITFIVVTYNSETFLGPCLDFASSKGSVIVVDNASTDTSVEIAKGRCVVVLSNQENLGFAAAANIGARSAKTDIICFLNPDCFVDRKTVAKAQVALNDNPRCLAVPDFVDWSGVRTCGRQSGYTRWKLLADLLETGGHWRVGQWMRSISHANGTDWHWPVAACLFVNRDVFDQLTGFPETYFCYMEDVAIGQLAAARGIPTVGLDSAVVHLERRGADVGAKTRNVLLDRARLTYARLQYGRAYVLFVRGLRRMLRIMSRLKALSGAHAMRGKA
ncbi:MAG: glycosyltransferase [Alphaproteobacteria bacterium]|nr:glycosyltransferase [Alphaproteobacteria bacterium]